MGVHSVLAFLAVVERHIERRLDRFGHAFRLVRIDDHRAVEFWRGAGKLRQDEYAGILGILRGDIF